MSDKSDITSQWYASVSYKDGEREYVPISDITIPADESGKEETPFLPTSLTDFTYGKKYIVRTKLGLAEKHRYYAFIGRLAESKQAITDQTSGRRSKFPTQWIDNDSSEPESSSPDEQTVILSQALRESRNRNKNSTINKKKAEDTRYESFLAQNTIGLSLESQKEVPSDTSAELNEKQALVKKIKELEAQLALSQQETRSVNLKSMEEIMNRNMENMKNMEKRLEETMAKMRNDLSIRLENVESMKNDISIGLESQERMNKDFKELVEQRFSKLEECMKQSSKSSTHPSTSTDICKEADEEVDLGSAITCLKPYYEGAVKADSHSEWSLCILKGVFKENAKKMRLIASRSTDTVAFSERFLNVAKFHHRKWLEAKNKLEPSEVEKYVSELPAYLAKRATALNGPRGFAKKVKAAREAGQEKPERPDKPPAKKRKQYSRRGEPPIKDKTSENIEVEQEVEGSPPGSPLLLENLKEFETVIGSSISMLGDLSNTPSRKSNSNSMSNSNSSN